ncbi:Type 1 glutamine amidotransferase-like domain-containing protein [Brevibacillus migulae]|uniref:Type 1 glutamine amidotransferase-like domain-containing protein n=1 Tax=Brevibacillus migulae TaxID=1644114 RepID=UPI001F1CBFDC|nr:Type 1 glutamine amidotransferase-like domain-containing protein [Brevibacillus migulae]
MIAIGGGYNGGDFDKEIEQKIRSFLPKDEPTVIFVPYASNDFEDNYRQFKEIYESQGCIVKLLEPGKENLLLQADLIYLGRGWTIPLLKKLDETNAKSFLLQAYEKGAMIAGFSAGAHALFTLAGSNEENIGYVLVEGLNLIHGCMISHYNYTDRATAFHRLLSERKLNGIGLEDHTMMVVENDRAKVYSTKIKASGHIIKTEDDYFTVKPIKNEEFVLPL